MDERDLPALPVAELLEWLRTLGIQVREYPAGVFAEGSPLVTDPLRAVVRARSAEIVAYLREQGWSDELRRRRQRLVGRPDAVAADQSKLPPDIQDRLWNRARYGQWLDEHPDRREGARMVFHARDGLMFERIDETAGVRVTLPGGQTIDLTPEIWASVVAAVCPSGETTATFRRALNFHSEGRHEPATAI